MVVDQCLLCLTDRLLDSVELLRDVHAGPAGFDHFNNASQVALGAFQALGDAGVCFVYGLLHNPTVDIPPGRIVSSRRPVRHNQALRDFMACSSSKTVIYAALAGNLLVAGTKFAAASSIGSAAVLSEAIHSSVDTGNQLLLLLGMRRAARPATPAHPFG